MKISLIVGLPGSGKTTLCNKMKGLVIDDISKCTNNIPSYLRKIATTDHLIISDVYFCLEKTRKDALKVIEKLFPNSEIEWIFFENSPDKCSRNVKRRDDKRKVDGLIKTLTKVYKIPKNAKVVEIHDE